MKSELAATTDSPDENRHFVEEVFDSPDLTDSYFFDHALDHLPGTFLVSKTLSAASRSAVNPNPILDRCDFSWHHFAELDPAVVCRATVSEDCFEGHLFQSKKLANFQIRWNNKDPKTINGGQHPSQVDKPKPIFAHKKHEQNVLVSTCHKGVENKLQCYLLAPVAGHQLACKTKHLHPLLLLEGCKQFLTVAGQTMFAGFANQGPNSKFQLILKGFSLESRRPIATTAKPHLQLDEYNLKKWRRNVPKAADFTVSIYVGTEVANVIRLESLVVEPEFFRYLRSQSK